LQSGGKDKGDAEFPESCDSNRDVSFLTKSACVTGGGEGDALSVRKKDENAFLFMPRNFLDIL
jgi:hypothetical protein